jgi:fructosamine-3-kinase
VSTTFTKSFRSDSPGSPSLEAAGLRWLAEAENQGGVSTPAIFGIGHLQLDMERIETVPASRTAALAFGRALAVTHAAGAPHFGAPPAGWRGQGGSIGLAPLPFTEASGAPLTWGHFYARHRVQPYVRWAIQRGGLSERSAGVFEDLAERLVAGDFDAPQPAGVPAVARIHGDLWSGNVMWTAPPHGPGHWSGATIIDPAAHGGHAETDLAMLGLFGVPHLAAILDAYNERCPIAPGWRARVALHRLHPLLVHAMLFGPTYGREAVAIARQYV